MSLNTPGFGHLYIDDLKKSFLIPTIPISALLLLGWFNLLSIFYGFITGLIIIVSVSIFAIVDSVKIARHRKTYLLKSYNRWYVMI